jgi:uncharacterized protein
MNVEHDKTGLRFFIETKSEDAELTYSFVDDDVMDFEYTFVPESSRGQGLADHLVKTGFEFAREQGKKVVPSCPVVSTYAKRHPEYKHLIINE